MSFNDKSISAKRNDVAVVLSTINSIEQMSTSNKNLYMTYRHFHDIALPHSHIHTESRNFEHTIFIWIYEQQHKFTLAFIHNFFLLFSHVTVHNEGKMRSETSWFAVLV